MEAEIGRNEAAPFLREFGVKSKAGRGYAMLRIPALYGNPIRDRIVNEINKFMIIWSLHPEPCQAPLNLPLDLAAAPTGLGRRRLLGRPRRCTQAVDGGEENHGRIDIRIADFGHLAAVDPAQERVAALAVDPEHAGHRVDAVALHQPQRAGFGGQPVARVAPARRVLFEREGARTASYAPDAAVAAAGNEPAHLDGTARQRARHLGRFGERAVRRAQGPA